MKEIIGYIFFMIGILLSCSTAYSINPKLGITVSGIWLAVIGLLLFLYNKDSNQ